jgi:fatty-acyl-CoA synthase
LIRAVIVLKEGFGIDAKTIQRYCQTKLASFKIPKDFIFVNQLPKTGSGKVQKHLLRNFTNQHFASGITGSG